MNWRTCLELLKLSLCILLISPVFVHATYSQDGENYAYIEYKSVMEFTTPWKADLVVEIRFEGIAAQIMKNIIGRMDIEETEKAWSSQIKSTYNDKPCTIYSNKTDIVPLIARGVQMDFIGLTQENFLMIQITYELETPKKADAKGFLYEESENLYWVPTIQVGGKFIDIPFNLSNRTYVFPYYLEMTHVYPTPEFKRVTKEKTFLTWLATYPQEFSKTPLTIVFRDKRHYPLLTAKIRDAEELLNKTEKWAFLGFQGEHEKLRKELEEAKTLFYQENYQDAEVLINDVISRAYELIDKEEERIRLLQVALIIVSVASIIAAAWILYKSKKEKS